MKQYLKTYGIRGMNEVHLLLPVGKCKMAVDFTGGNSGGDGASPAEFATKDPFTQSVIEHSDPFKRGYILLLRKIVIGEVPAAKKEPAPEPVKEVKEEVTSDGGADKPGDAENNETTDTTENTSTVNVVEVEVGSRGDAKAYLMKTFGVEGSAIATKAKLEQYAKDRGIVFKGSLD